MKNKRNIKYIFVHCTATRSDASVQSILNAFKLRDWSRPGYHYLVDRYGKIHTLWPESDITNGVRGYNRNSIHIAYIGGVDGAGRASDTRTFAQRVSLRSAVRCLQSDYPSARVLGHRDISPDTNGNGRVDAWERIKECPSFDVATEL